MKTDPRMESILKKASKDPEFLTEIIPVFQSFANYGDIKPYQHYLPQIIEVCKKWEGKNKMAEIIPELSKSYVQFCFGQYEKAKQLVLSLKSKHDLNIDADHYGFAEMLLGVSMRDAGEIDAALVHFLNATKSINKSGSLANFRCYAFYIMAEIHMQINDLETAGKYYKKALAISQKVDHKIAVFRSLIGLGTWYRIKKKYKKSIRLFKRALKVESMSEASRSRVLRDLGVHYLSLKKFKKAIKFLEQSYELAMKNGYSNPASTCLIHLGKVYLAIENPDKALEVLREALEISLEHKTRAKQMEIEPLLASTYEVLQNFEKAYQHLKIAQQIKEEINTEKQREIFKIKNRMIEEQKEVIKKERDRSNKLLLNILPDSIATELKENQFVEPKRFEQATVLFADFVGFTSISEALSSEELVKNLDHYFRAFDKIITKYRLEKIKTIGDAYMCAGGLPEISSTHAQDIVKAALEMQSYVKKRQKNPKIKNVDKWSLRIGIHSGPVIAGVVGDIKFVYDIWGDTVNTASRMESNSEEGKVNVSESTFELLSVHPDFTFIPRGKINVKNKGEIEMYFVENGEAN